MRTASDTARSTWRGTLESVAWRLLLDSSDCAEESGFAPPVGGPMADALDAFTPSNSETRSSRCSDANDGELGFVATSVVRKLSAFASCRPVSLKALTLGPPDSEVA